MTEELITYNTAVLAKEKGFDIHCRDFYEKGIAYENEDFPYNSYINSIFAPKQSFLQRWLREIHKIHIEIFYMDEFLMYGYKLTNTFTNTEYEEDFEYSSLRNEQGFIKGFSYEECLEAALCQALNLIP